MCSGQILTPFYEHLSHEEKEYRFFQQGSGTVHTANNLVAALHNSFEGAMISQPLWPAHLPDLTPCDFSCEEFRKTAHIKAVHLQGMKLKK
jgi:hypothetical protein